MRRPRERRCVAVSVQLRHNTWALREQFAASVPKLHYTVLIFSLVPRNGTELFTTVGASDSEEP